MDTIVDAAFLGLFLQHIQTTPVKVVLIAEDHPVVRSSYKAHISPEIRVVEVSEAETRSQVEHLIAKWGVADIAIVDACIPGSRPNSFELLQKLRELPNVPLIIGTSMEERWRDQLRDSGLCHVILEKTKIMDWLFNQGILPRV